MGKLQDIIVGLVRDEEDPPMTDDEVREYGRSFGLTEEEVEVLVEIAQAPIGY